MTNPPTNTLTLACRVRPSPQVRMQATGDEAVLLDLASERYFGLNPVGTRAWQLLSDDGSIETAFGALSREYDVAPEQLERDLLTLLQQLLEAGLVVQD